MTISLSKVARRHAAIGILAMCSSYGLLASAQSQNPIVVMDSTDSSYYYGYRVSDTEWRGPAFTSGPVPTRITEIILGLVPPSATNPLATLRLFQLDDATALPSGSALATTSLTVVDNTNINTNLSPNTYTSAQLGPISTITLLPNRKYALILSSASNAPFDLNDNGLDNSYTYAGGFSVAADGYLQTLNSGANWQPVSGTTPAFRLTVVPVVQAVTPTPVPTLSVFSLVALTSAIAFLGIRKSRRST